MLESFTEPARRVLARALEETLRSNRRKIAPEHLLVGLLRESDGATTTALASQNVTLAGVREGNEEIFGHLVRDTHTPLTRPWTKSSRKVRYTPSAREALDIAISESQRLGHDYVGTEHILLSLLSNPEGNAASVLTRTGVELDVLRGELLRMLGADGRGTG